MAHTGATPTTELLDLSDPATDSEDLFASPSRSIKEQRSSQQTRPEPGSLSTADTSSREPRHDADLDSEQAHEAALRRELAGIRSINEVLEEVVNSLEQARGNMDAVSRTVTNASNLLHTWTRILSQTEHNQRLILNPSWQGASQDISALETETIRRRQEQERKEMEEQSREARARKAEDDERKREEAEEDVELGGSQAVVTSELGGRAEEDQAGVWEQSLAGRAVGSVGLDED
ncbi:hypothetical protein MMC07_004205 [Pseudocyphellaria aurata]|nr:hypothetical protein [Pseudocyphellaria aurata]